MPGGFPAWAKRPENTLKLVGVAAGVGLAIGLAGLVGPADGGLTAGRRGKPKPKNGEPKKGFLVCPGDVGKIPTPLTGATRGDFIIIELASADSTFVEPTWARIRSFSPTRDKVYVEISGEHTKVGIKPLASDQHGFVIGERLVVERNCIFDVLRKSTKFTGQVLCGPNLGVILGGDGQPAYRLVDTTNATTSNIVKVVVASPEAQGTAWHEPLWVHVTSISPSQQIIRGVVAQQPTRTADHGLTKYSGIEFGRDCVVDISTPYLLGD